MRIGILAFDEVEVLDLCGPFEVFSVAARLQRRHGDDDPLEVVVIGVDPAADHVVARGGLRIAVDTTIADETLADAWALDILIVPGGVTDAVEADPAAIAWIAAHASTPMVASVCTGAFLLAGAGILAERRVTTHWEDAAALAERFPALDVVTGVRWVESEPGRLFTSAGISAGIDLALHLVDRIEPGLGDRTAHQMDFQRA